MILVYLFFNYPFIVLGLSLFSSTIYSFFNIGFFLFCVIGACLKLNVKIFKNRYLFSYFVYFIFFIAIFTNASAIRFHPLLLFFFMAWFSLNFSRRQIIVSEIMTLTGVFISVITGVLLWDFYWSAPASCLLQYRIFSRRAIILLSQFQKRVLVYQQ